MFHHVSESKFLRPHRKKRRLAAHRRRSRRGVKRSLIAFVAAIALGFACYNVVAPLRIGTLGLSMAYRNGAAVAVVAPGGPAARAGIRNGDVFSFAQASLATRAAAVHIYGSILERSGTVYAVPLIRSGVTSVVDVTAQPGGTALDPTSATAYARYVDFGLAVLYLLFAGIIFFKASRSELSELLVALMVMFTLINSLSDYQWTAPNTVSGYIVGSIVQYAGNVVTAALVFTIVATLPSELAGLRRWIRLCAIPLGILSFGGADFSSVFAPFSIALLAPPVLEGGAVIAGIVGVFGAVASIALVHTTAPEERVRARWFASTLVVCWFLGFTLYTLNSTFFGNAMLNTVQYYVISFSMVGPVYATLRHRLVDLDVVISRSAVFAFVSLMLVAAFVAAEWIAENIASALVGNGHWHGVTTQALSFAAAIAIGLSARSVHAGVERRVNALVFRDRARRLALLEAFAHEADLVDSTDVLLKLAYESLLQSMETADVALYISDGAGFACVRTSSMAAPERLDKSDRLVLRLLYRPEPFVSDRTSLHGWLIVPLMVRADVTGFLACGTKRDHTAYLNDEIRVLETVSHHVATSYALLRGSARAELR